MTEEELRRQIIEKFRDKLASGGTEIKIIKQERPPSPQELVKQNATLSPLGIVGKYRIFLVIAYSVYNVYATALDIPDTIEKTKLYVPKAYEYAIHLAKDVKEGALSALGENEKDGYLIIKPIWLADKSSFIRDQEEFGLGSRSIFSDTTAVCIPTSGASLSMRDNTITYDSTATRTIVTSLKV